VPVTPAEAERSHILKTLRPTEGVVGDSNDAAARLGLCRTTLILRMKRLGISLGKSSVAMPAGASFLMSEDPTVAKA
jgi:transcriptional regulator with GAF, ATPase, and Fis domain